jgi:DNA gyrase subunit A
MLLMNAGGFVMDNAAEILPINIEDEMKGSYLDYAMSVIIGRAIPDIRDGLKPAHRRILYAMLKEGLLSTKRFSKCAGVVGEVLKKYHPHGDAAVYDTLVRMAQDWNMRYTLIEGQGNFGCFTGDTNVRLADGSTKSFKKLVEDYAEGKRHFTYTIRSDGKIAMGEIRSPRLTKKMAEVVKVTLDDGGVVCCTPDHRFMRRDGTYCEARKLKPGDSLMPFYNRFYDGADLKLQGYEEVYDPSSDEWLFAHHLADVYNVENRVYSRNAGKVRHHKDFNKFNNDPRNIRRMAWAGHRRLHHQWLKELWKEPNFRSKMQKVLSNLWKDPHFREKTINAIAKENKRRWKDEGFRKKQLAALKELWGDHDFRDKILSAAMEKNVLLHGTDEQRRTVTRAQKEWLLAMWRDPGYVSAQRERMRALSIQMWKDPAHRENISRSMRDRMKLPENLARASAWSRGLWSDTNYRAERAKQSTMQWQDPQYRASHAVHLSDNGRKTTISRFLTICKRTLENGEALNEENYNKVRKASKVKGIIRFDRGISRYFNGDIKSLKAACEAHHGRLNHTVVSVEPAGKADVYDLTVGGTHNFALASGIFVHNSIDGDPAAAYRYTEARLTSIAEQLLADIERETVDFIPNFDGTTEEPTVLPSRVPNLLINGSDGIAVGMATKIPPHNLSEIVDGCVAIIDKPSTSLDELIKLIPGPDFPTGAFIDGREGILEAYKTGKGQIKLRAKAMIEPMAKGERESIIITEIPYQVNKARLIERIAELVKEGKIDGISDIRDESDRDGMRIVVELKRGVVAGVVLNQLYAHTAMQSSYGIILLAIVGGQPKVLDLRESLALFLDHRKDVVTRRTSYDLRKAEERAHVLAGLKVAVENIDEVVAIVKKAKEPIVARDNLMKRFKLSEIQAQAILDLKLQRLTGLERAKIVEEYDEMQALIKELKAILADEKKIYKIIRDELLEIKQKYGDARRTIIQSKQKELKVEDLIQEEEMVVTVSHRGYIKRNPISIYRAQRRGGKGKQGIAMRDEDFVENLFVASTHSYVLVFSTAGRVYWLKVHEIPQLGRVAKGQAVTNLINMSSDEGIAAILPVKEFSEGQFVVMATKNGVIKKTELMSYSNPRAGGIIATTIDEDDELISVRLTTGDQQIFLTTREGQAIRFSEGEVRSMGRQARGVKGINLHSKDEVVGMEALYTDASILTITQCGYGKRSPCDEYRIQSRGGSGIITMKVSDRNGPVVGVMQVTDADDIMLVTDSGKVIRSRAKEIPTIGRNTQGVRLISLDGGEKVVSVARLAEEEDEEGDEAVQ